MLNLCCDTCKAPIDPQKDRYFDVPRMDIFWGTHAGRVMNLHFCEKKCFIVWIQKNSEPSTIITAQNPLGPAL